MKRDRLLPFIPYILCAAFVYAGWIWHQGDLRVTESGANTGEAVKTVTVGGPFALVDQHGKHVTDADYLGKHLLVFFGFTYCPDVCPTTLAVLSAVFDKLGKRGDKLVSLFITIDPARDTPEELKNYLDAFGPQFVGLTGNDEDIAAVAKAYRVYYKRRDIEGDTYTMDHSSIIYLMDARGKYVTNYSLEQGPDKIAEDLAKRLR